MRKTILILLSILILLVSFSSCSEDPRVAPTRVFIVSVNGEKREVSFDNNIRFVRIGIYETVSLDAVTNRVPTGAKLIWSSIAPEVANVDENGLCTGLSLGDTIIKVSLNGGKETAVCWVSVVADPDHIPDAEEGVSSIEIVSLVELMHRDILTVENGTPTIKAESLEALSSIAFPVKCVLEDTKYPGATVEYQWSMNGVSLTERTSESEVFYFDTFGNFTIVVQPIVRIPGVPTPIPTKSATINVDVIPRRNK